MGSIVLFTVLAVATAAVVIGIVAVGMVGKGRDHHPRAARVLGRLARALNGDAEPPRSLVRLLG